MTDKQTVYKYCECARGETKHDVYQIDDFEGVYFVYTCTECGEEK